MQRLNQSWVKVQNWYRKYERPASSISLVGGFVFDAITLTRVDELWENIWVGLHLIVVAIAILVLNLREPENRGDEMSSFDFWLVNILQFFFGGLLSTYIVFYFRSSTLIATWPFMFLLVVAFIANESLKKHYARLVFQISLFFLSLFSFAIFAVPILLHKIGPSIFVLSGLISLGVMSVFLYILRSISKRDFKEQRSVIIGVVLGIYGLINGLYFTHLIPPLPLALKAGGIYHDIDRNSSGDYEVLAEGGHWWRFFKLYDEFHFVRGNPVYAYSAVFSPSKLNLDIVHEWQHYDKETGKWVTLSRVPLSVFGGRDGGFRTYSTNYNLPPGKSRVNVETAKGELIGRLAFTLVETKEMPQLELEIQQ